LAYGDGQSPGVAEVPAREIIRPRGQEDFEVPPNIVLTPVDYETGLKATPDSPLPILEAFPDRDLSSRVRSETEVILLR